MRNSEKTPAVLVLAAAFSVLLVYSLTATETYAWTDVYQRLASPFSSFVQDASGGRVLAGPLMFASFAAADSIPRLRYLRALGLVGIALLAASLAHLVRREGVPVRYALFLAVTSALLPPFQMYAGWATAWTFSWTCLLSLWA